jgi:hypothetical protein
VFWIATRQMLSVNGNSAYTLDHRKLKPAFADYRWQGSGCRFPRMCTSAKEWTV